MHDLTKKDFSYSFPNDQWVETLSEKDVSDYLSEAKEWKKEKKLNEKLYQRYSEEKPSLRGYYVVFYALDSDEADSYWKYHEKKNREKLIDDSLNRCKLCKDREAFQLCEEHKQKLLDSLETDSDKKYANEQITKLGI